MSPCKSKPDQTLLAHGQSLNLTGVIVFELGLIILALDVRNTGCVSPAQASVLGPTLYQVGITSSTDLAEVLSNHVFRRLLVTGGDAPTDECKQVEVPEKSSSRISV